jgi:alanyl-tRNA synthetase
MTAFEIIKKYIDFFEKKEHKQIANAPLVPDNDPTTLFTSSGMQPLVPYLLGEEHPQGKRLVNFQDSFRSQDIEEIGDNRHTTFFRMLGNWSLGSYFKKEQIIWFWEFLTKELKIPKEKLYVSVFAGDENIARDTESEKIWKEIFAKENLSSKDRIFFYGVTKNWWSRSGIPSKMPIGEPGGPDSEVFYDFLDPKIHGESKYKDQKCHINCDCGRYMEIGNSVFMEFIRTKDGFSELPQKNVDFGGGLERLLAASENEQDIFKTSLYFPAIKKIEELSIKKYDDDKPAMRIIADHLKASIFIILAHTKPSNKEQGYVLRRLIRRSVVKYHELTENFTPILEFKKIAEEILKIEEKVEPKRIDSKRDLELVSEVFEDELTRFGKSLNNGLKVIERTDKITGKEAFDLYQSYGFPLEITIELMEKKEQKVDVEEFRKEFEKHKELSRNASSGMFRGGLADSGKQTVMGHTATHLLHKALKNLLGKKVNQSGSNITNERIRFDFSFERKLTDEEIKRIEDAVNKKIEENLPVHFEIMPLEKAKEIGAIGLFNEKYEEKVKVYSIGNYSKEICGGPHVDFTGKLKRFKIIKQENIGHGLKRIYAKVNF